MTGAPAAPAPALLDDYDALRGGVGARWIERDFLRVEGPQALEYLEGQCSQELGTLGIGSSADSLLLAPDGKIVALVRVSRTAEDELVLDFDGGFADLVEARLRRFKLRSKFEIERVRWSCLALRGPNAPEAGPAGGRAGDGTALALPVSWNGWGGLDLVGPDPVAPSGDVRWCGDDAWEACRIEAGVPRMGRELDGRTIPAEAGLVERTVSFTKGCYTGQELVARLDSRGSRVARRLCAVVPGPGPGTGPGPEPSALLDARLTSLDGAKEVGRITSAAWCPAVGGPAGLAFVHRSVEPGGRVLLELPSAPGAPGPVTAEVRSLPLA